MTKRLVRARRRIRDARVPLEVPPAEQLPDRSRGVLAALYLIFNEGYAASACPQLLRIDLCTEAIHLTRVLASLLPQEPEVHGLLALMRLHHARRGPVPGDHHRGGRALVLADGATATAMSLFTKQPPLGAANTFTPGQSDGIKGSGCQPCSPVTAYIDDVAVGTPVTQSAQEGPDRLVLGVYHLRLPADGQHTLRSACPPIADGMEYSHPKPITVK